MDLHPSSLKIISNDSFGHHVHMMMQQGRIGKLNGYTITKWEGKQYGLTCITTKECIILSSDFEIMTVFSAPSYPHFQQYILVEPLPTLFEAVSESWIIRKPTQGWNSSGGNLFAMLRLWTNVLLSVTQMSYIPMCFTNPNLSNPESMLGWIGLVCQHLLYDSCRKKLYWVPFSESSSHVKTAASFSLAMKRIFLQHFCEFLFGIVKSETLSKHNFDDRLMELVEPPIPPAIDEDEEKDDVKMYLNNWKQFTPFFIKYLESLIIQCRYNEINLLFLDSLIVSTKELDQNLEQESNLYPMIMYQHPCAREFFERSLARASIEYNFNVYNGFRYDTIFESSSSSSKRKFALSPTLPSSKSIRSTSSTGKTTVHSSSSKVQHSSDQIDWIKRFQSGQSEVTDLPHTEKAYPFVSPYNWSWIKTIYLFHLEQNGCHLFASRPYWINIQFRKHSKLTCECLCEASDPHFVNVPQLRNQRDIKKNNMIAVEAVDELMQTLINFFKKVDQHLWSKTIHPAPLELIQSLFIYYNDETKEVRPLLRPFDPLNHGQVYKALCEFHNNEWDLSWLATSLAVEKVLIPLDILLLVSSDPAFQSSMYRKQQQLWEMATMFIWCFRMFLPDADREISFKMVQLPYAQSIESAIREFNNVETMPSHLIIFPWIATDMVSISLSKLFTRDPSKRPSLSNWINDQITTIWIQENHFRKIWEERVKELFWKRSFESENDEFSRLVDDPDNNPVVGTKDIPLQLAWKFESQSNQIQFLKQWVNHISKASFFTKISFKNRYFFSVKWMIEKDFPEPSKGPGLAQDALHIYSTVVKGLDMLNPESSFYKNVKEEYWLVLGICLAQCLFLGFGFELDVKPHFFKWCLKGNAASLDLYDLAYQNRSQALYFVKLLIDLDAQVIDSLELDFEDVNVPLLSKLGPVNRNNIVLYVKHQVQKLLCLGINPTHIDALHKGFQMTKSETDPTFKILFCKFCNIRTPTVQDLINAILVCENKSETDIPQNHHYKNRCFDAEHRMDNFQLCFFSCLKKWILCSNESQRKSLCKFITGSTILRPHDPLHSTLEVTVKNITVAKEYRMPSAATCFQQFTLNQPMYLQFANYEACYQWFSSQLQQALDLGQSFGYQ